MDTKRNYYLIVPVDNIYIKKANQDTDVFTNTIAIEIFRRYNIPEEFQKMIFKISIGGITEPTNTFELITNKIFYFKTPILKALFNPISNPIIEMLSKETVIVTENKLYHTENIKAFYQSIIDNNLAQKYDTAIKEILNIQKEKTFKGIFTKTKKKK